MRVFRASRIEMSTVVLQVVHQLAVRRVIPFISHSLPCDMNQNLSFNDDRDTQTRPRTTGFVIVKRGLRRDEPRPP